MNTKVIILQTAIVEQPPVLVITTIVLIRVLITMEKEVLNTSLQVRRVKNAENGLFRHAGGRVAGAESVLFVHLHVSQQAASVGPN